MAGRSGDSEMSLSPFLIGVSISLSLRDCVTLRKIPPGAASDVIFDYCATRLMCLYSSIIQLASFLGGSALS